MLKSSCYNQTKPWIFIYYSEQTERPVRLTSGTHKPMQSNYKTRLGTHDPLNKRYKVTPKYKQKWLSVVLSIDQLCHLSKSLFFFTSKNILLLKAKIFHINCIKSNNNYDTLLLLWKKNCLCVFSSCLHCTYIFQVNI